MFLEIKDLAFRYAKNVAPILEGFDLSMAAGEIVGIAGQSGSGKSTLLRIIAGLEKPDTGSIRIDGALVADSVTFVPPEHRQVGLVFQDYGLFPHMTVAGNIDYGLHRLTRAERKEQVAAMLDLIHMAALGKRYPYELSGGQQQRVALARALAPKPKLLLMDEPFSNLDAELKSSIRNEVYDILTRTGATCLFVSHDRADLEAVCCRVIASCSA